MLRLKKDCYRQIRLESNITEGDFCSLQSHSKHAYGKCCDISGAWRGPHFQTVKSISLQRYRVTPPLTGTPPHPHTHKHQLRDLAACHCVSNISHSRHFGSSKGILLFFSFLFYTTVRQFHSGKPQGTIDLEETFHPSSHSFKKFTGKLFARNFFFLLPLAFLSV